MAVLVKFFTLLVLLSWALVEGQQLPYACDSQIYCLPGNTSLLHVVQMARLYNDSKTFVDKPLKHSPALVLQNFNKMMQEHNNKPGKDTIQKFVDDNFNEEGSEFEDWEPSDWNETIPVFDNIKDPAYKAFAMDLHERWKELGRKISSDVKNKPEQYSQIYMERPFVVPGGRFREMYYWDSYWTIQGLLVSKMHDTVKGMLENFAGLINRFNLIPNGNRVYYKRRSQPPLFIAMVDEYFQATNNRSFVENHIATMDKEFNYWMTNRTMTVTVEGQPYTLAHYDVEVDGPRPESYYEDFRDAQTFQTVGEQQEFYMNMKSGAESGWDYSTRWFVKENGSPSTELTDIETRHIIPVELNSYLCRNAEIMEKLHNMLGHEAMATRYRDYREQFVESIDKVLWNSEIGAWLDYDTKHNRQRKYFYPSNIAPLWAECYPQTRMLEKIKRVIDYMEMHKAFQYPGGVPTSMVKSGQQWDFSNAWPPLQEIVVTGLEKSGTEDGKDLALKVVKKWVKNNYVSYIQSGKKMFEKYDVEQIGLPGGGGEYDVQEGFGWSNGVLMHFFNKYGDVISSDDDVSGSTSLRSSRSLVRIYVVSVVSYLIPAYFYSYVYA